jgi:hypothetical protein
VDRDVSPMRQQLFFQRFDKHPFTELDQRYILSRIAPRLDDLNGELPRPHKWFQHRGHQMSLFQRECATASDHSEGTRA